MLELRDIYEEEETLELFRSFSEGTELPDFLFHDPRYIRVVKGLYDGEEPLGLAFGVMKEGDSHFYLHHLSMDDACRDVQGAIDFIHGLFRAVHEKHGATKAVVTMHQEDDRKPSVLALLRKLPCETVSELRYIRQIGMKTADFDHLRKLRFYMPERLAQKGYEILPWSQCPPEELQRLREYENAEDKPKDYLSPGLWEEDWSPEPKTSRMLVRKGEKKPVGWMSIEGLSDGKTAKIRRLYIEKNARSNLIGHAFSTKMLDLIAEHYENLYYEIVRGNRQIEAYTDNFCTPVLTINYYQCHIFIDFNME